MNKGTVRFYNHVKGLGLIKDIESEKEYFVHSTGLIDTINIGDKVSFDLQEGKKGWSAVNVMLVTDY